MLQKQRALAFGDRLWQAIASGWHGGPYRGYLVRLLYAALLGAIVYGALGGRAPLADVPAAVWGLGLGVIALLAPDAGRWVLIGLVAVSLATTSLAVALVLVGAAVLAVVLAHEDPEFGVPVRFALLLATPVAALHDLALLPLAIAVAVFARAAWWEGLVQGLVIAGYVAATGTILSWTGIAGPITSLVAMGGPVATGDWWNHMGTAWDTAIGPWTATVMREPTPYLRLIGTWTFAALVGGYAVGVFSRPFLMLAAACVAPLLAAIGVAALHSTTPEPGTIALAIASGIAAYFLAALINPSDERVPTTKAPYVTALQSRLDTPPTLIRPAKWSDIAGYDDVKREVREALEPLTNQQLRERLMRAGIEPTHGILLYGPPGTGKTLLARAAASELGLGFVLVAGPEVLNKYVGESEAGVRRAFEEARAMAPSILFVDEIEALVPQRSGEAGGMSGVHRTIVATFLGLMDGARAGSNVVVMAATNLPDQMDTALLRPGRFDRVIYVPPPDPQTRRIILERHLEGKPGAKNVDVARLVKPTERFTGADLAGLVRRAYEATRGDPVHTEELLTLAQATKPTITLAMLDQYRALAERFGRSSRAMAQMDPAPRPKLNWDDVGGLDAAKQTLREAVMLPLEHPDLVARFGVRPSRGVLLYGPPGTGKTMLARVVADQARATFLSASGSELAGPTGPEAIRRLFARARETTPAVIFIDEIDAIGRRGLAALGGTAAHQLLVEMDGVRPTEGLIVMAATNRPQDIDEALLRPGRFDFHVKIGLPDVAARKAILALHLRGKPGAEEIDVDRLAEVAEGLSPAQIAAAVNAAARQMAMQAAKEGNASARDLKVTTESVLAQLEG